MELVHLPIAPSDKVDGKEINSQFLYLLIASSTIGGFLFGYDTGVISGVLILIKRPEVFNLSAFQSEFVVSAAIFGAIVGAACSSCGNQIFGRKPVILLSSFFFLIGSLVMTAALTYQIVIVGRFIVGLGIGFSSMTVPLYIAEVSPARIRGKLVSLNTLLVTGGQFLACVLSALMSSQKEGWRYMLGLAAIPASIQFFAFFLLPESPRYLLTKPLKKKEAFAALVRIRGTENVAEEFDCIIKELSSENEEEGSVWSVIERGPVLRALILGCLLNALQQFSGINTVMYYGATILQIAGFNEPSTAIWMAAVVSFSNFLFTFVGLRLVDRAGRRILTLGSLAGVIVSLFALGSSFYIAHAQSTPVSEAGACHHAATCFDCVSNDMCGFCGYSTSDSVLHTDSVSHNMCLFGNSTTDSFGVCAPGQWSYGSCANESGLPSWFILIALFIYLAFFASGMGPMPWTINAEIYPLAARSYALSISTSVNWFSNLIMSFTFLTMVQGLAPYGAFWLYGMIALAGWIYLYYALPETKGLSLEEIQDIFNRGRKLYDRVQ